MEITFTMNEFSLETSPYVDRATLLDMLSRSAWHELQKTSDSEIVVRADMGEHKLEVYLEKHPGAVDDGFITMKDYLHDRISALILSMYRTRDLEVTQ